MHGHHFTSQLGTADSQLGQLVLGWWEPEQTDGHFTTIVGAATAMRTSVATETVLATGCAPLTTLQTRLT